MKNQYFGDNKDLWKYDLVMTIMQAGLAEQFTFVPMLTEPDGTNHGGKIDRRHARAGTENKELVNFLDERLNRGQRDIELMGDFFKRYGIKMKIYYGEDGYFSHRKRKSYFAGIKIELLSKSLILLDPDNGLEVKRPNEKHVLYSEVKELYGRMDKASTLMLYQYFPRASRPDYLNTRMQELKDKVSGDYPVCAYDSEIAFFFLTKNNELEHELIHIIGEYSKRYGK
jgi:hypothetical protein